MIIGAASTACTSCTGANRFPIRGTKAEKRAERGVALAFLISALAGVGFIVAFVALPVSLAPARHRRRTSASTRRSLGALLGLMLVVHGLRRWCSGPSG